MSAGSSNSHKRSNSKPKGALRAKSGCYTCRIRRKKCDEKPNEEGACQTCVRLRLQCLGYGAKRPEWMREGNSVAEIREKIKNFLAENGMIKGHSGPATLRTAGSSSSPPGASASLNTTSPLGTSFPLSQAMADQGTGDLSTPLSATSTLTPEDRSSSPMSPPDPRVPLSTYATDRSFPPNYVHTGVPPHYEQGYEQGRDNSASMLQQDDLPNTTSGVLLLSKGRPIPPRTQSQIGPIRHSRRTTHSNTLGTPISNGLGLFAMEHPDTDGQGSTINNSNTRYGHPASNFTTFPRSRSMTAIAPLNANVTAPAHVSPMSSVSSRFSNVPSLSSSSPAASCPTPYPYTPSIAPPTANFISNAGDSYSPTFGSASSTSSSPPMPSHDISFTPYTPLLALPSLSPSVIKPTDNLHVPNTVSMSPYTSTSATGTDVALFSPSLDAGSFGSGMDDDMNFRLTSIHSHNIMRSNRASNTNLGSNVRVKTEPDIGFDILHTHTADDSNSILDTTAPLRPRSMGDGRYAAPRTNSYTNANTGLAHNDIPMNSHYYDCTYNTINNHSYNHGHNATATHSDSSRVSVAPTPMDTCGEYAMYTPGVWTVNSPYNSAPQLSPDSPRPPPRPDPLIGAYPSASTSQMGGQALGDGHGYVSHAPGQFTLHSGNVRHGAVGGSSYNYAHSNGYTHDQTTTGSSWAMDGHVRHQHQDQLLNQQQGQMESQNSHQWTQTVRDTDMPPPSLQSSFGPLYHYQDDYLTTIGDIGTFAAQQAPIGSMAVNSVEDGALIPMYTVQAPISEEAFLGLSHDDQQRTYQEYAPTQLLQPALVDPMYADRTDRSLVEHYLRYVRPVQYFFLDERVVDLLRSLALTNDAVRNAICSVASVHKSRMREGGVPLRGRSPQGTSRRSPLALIESISDVPEGDGGIDYYARTQLALARASNEGLTEAEAMAGLQCISSFLFAGGLGEWDFFLGVACRWVETILAYVGRDYLQGVLAEMRRDNELQSFIVRTTMWFEVLASITIVREPKFLSVYRTLFAADGARIIEVDGSSIRTEAEFSMLEVMGCDNLTFLAIAEISALAAWKEEEIRKQTLSFVELAERKCRIEETCLRALAEGDTNIYRDEAAQRDDSLENRRRLTADIFRASARLYFHTVLSGDKPGVKEIRHGVIETIEALRRVPTEPKSLRRSVVRSVVFPICLAGCMTDDEAERNTLKQLLESEGGAGNCGSVVAVMETVWERRDRQRKNANARGGRRAEFETDVSWREVLRERGGGMPILLV